MWIGLPDFFGCGDSVHHWHLQNQQQLGCDVMMNTCLLSVWYHYIHKNSVWMFLLHDSSSF